MIENKIALPSGGMYDFVYPDSSVIDIEDIIEKLSKIQRFGGALVGEWSVLQHSLLVHFISRREGDHIRTQYTALHHDSPEAYMGDVVKPLRVLLRDYDRFYTRCAVMVQNALHVHDDLSNLPEEIQVIDEMAAKIEWYMFGKHTPDLLGMTDEMYETWNKDYVLGDFLNTLRTTDRQGVIDVFVATHNKLYKQLNLKRFDL